VLGGRDLDVGRGIENGRVDVELGAMGLPPVDDGAVAARKQVVDRVVAARV
jgi:hypothetical protein